jgi:hypothetical protein
MTCYFHQHKDILKVYSIYDRKYYQEHEQNRIFIILDSSLFIIDSSYYIRNCPHCKKRRNLYLRTGSKKTLLF